jgi:hypothetical protein
MSYPVKDVLSGELVSQYGRLWARNPKNIRQLRKLGNPVGVYVLCDRSTPVCVGKGQLHDRIDRHYRSKRGKYHWDHFSWFAVARPEFLHEVEAFLIRILPPYLGISIQQHPKLASKGVRAEQADKHVESPAEILANSSHRG